MKRKFSLAALALASLLGGCAVYPERDPYYDHSVRVAPPPLQYEYPGSPPVVGYVWITGYWNWVGVRYVWVPGRWEAPRPGYYWVPHRWEREGEHWRQHGGRWERDTRPHFEPQPAPRQPAPRVERYESPRPGTVPAPIFRSEPEQRPVPQERNVPPRFERDDRHPPQDGGALRFERKIDSERRISPPSEQREAPPQEQRRQRQQTEQEEQQRRQEHFGGPRPPRRSPEDER